MTYALGRELDARDQPAVREIMRSTEANRYRFWDLIALIVKKCPLSDEADAGALKGADMFITQKSLPRRTILRGAGTALALPLLDAMVPALRAERLTAAAPVRRLGFVMYPLGVDQDRWRPKGEGAATSSAKRWSRSLLTRTKFVVISGLSSDPDRIEARLS